MVFRKPVGRHVVLVCDSFACWSLGYAELRAAVEAELGVGMGQTTADGRFTLLPIVCLGACDRGPAMMVDDQLHGPVAPDQVAGILGELLVTSRPGLPGYSAEDRPFTHAMRADGRPAMLDDYVAAGGYEGLRRAVAELKPRTSPRW